MGFCFHTCITDFCFCFLFFFTWLRSSVRASSVYSSPYMNQNHVMRHQLSLDLWSTSMKPAPLSADQRPDGGDCLYKFSFLTLFILWMAICANSVQLCHLHLQQKVILKYLLFIPSLDVQEMEGRGHLYGVQGLYIKSALSEWLWMYLDLKKVGEQWCIQSSCSVWFSRASVLSPGLHLIASHVVRPFFVFAVKEELVSVILLILTIL